MQTNPLPPQDSDQSTEAPSRTRRVLFGCGCGCAIFLLILILTGYGAFKYFMGPGEQMPTESVLSQETVAFIHLDPKANELAARNLMASLIQTLGDIDPEDVPVERRQEMRDMIEAFEDVDFDMLVEASSFALSTVTVAFENGADGVFGGEAIGAFNISAGARLIRFGFEKMGAANGESKDHNDHSYMALDGDSDDLVGFQHDTLLFSNSESLLKRTFDRTDFDDTAPAPLETPMLPALRDLSSRYLLSAAAGVEQPLPAGFLRSLVEGIEDADTLVRDADTADWLDIQVDQLRLGAGLNTSDLNMRIEFLGISDADAEKLKGGLAELMQLLETDLNESGLVLSHETVQGNGNLVLNAWLPGFAVWLNDELRAAMIE